MQYKLYSLLKAEHFDDSSKMSISKEIIWFALSDDGYDEILEYYQRVRRDTEGFIYLVVNITDETDTVRVYSRRSIPYDPGSATRGFSDWNLLFIRNNDKVHFELNKDL